MQDKKAKIRASFDPSTGELLAEVSGSEFSLQYLLGVLVARLAQSHARLTDSTVLEALAKIIAGIVLVANKATPSNATKIDPSRAYKED